MSEEGEPASEDAPRERPRTVAAQGELALVSPVRSLAAISFTFLLFTQVFSRIALATVGALFPDAFPAQPDEEALVVPATTGLVAILVTTFANAILAGLLAGRIGRALRLWHGVALGAILGLIAAQSMSQLRGFPGWFAVGWLLAPAVGASLGGLLAERVGRQTNATRVVAEAVTPADGPRRSGDES